MNSSAPAAATRDTGQRVFGHDDRQPGFLAEQLVEIAQQRTTAGQHHAALGDVGREFGGRLLECALHRSDDAGERIFERAQDFIGIQREGTRHPFSKIAAAHFQLAQFATGEGGADFLLDALGSGLTDQAAMLAAHIGHDAVVEQVATDAHGIGIHTARQRESPTAHREAETAKAHRG